VNGALESSEDGLWKLRFTRDLTHPVEMVWRALNAPEHLQNWFPHRIVGDLLSPGAALRFEYPGGGFPTFDGRVLAVEPPTLLELRWGTDTIRFDLVSGDGNCVLRLTDTFDELGKAARDGAGWHTLSRPARVIPRRRFAVVHRRRALARRAWRLRRGVRAGGVRHRTPWRFASMRRGRSGGDVISGCH
jgi:uncharacterized protein YndB with AHSA1/START domain